MSSDRELLELAAKAAGHEVRLVLANGDLDIGLQHAAWNPLTDDGDALRLAVKRRIRFWIEGGTEAEWNQVWTVAQGAGPEVFVMHRGHGGDANAATRRAIVMAAADGAELGSP